MQNEIKTKIQVFATANPGAGRHTISNALGIPLNTVRTALSQLHYEGALAKNPRGGYHKPPVQTAKVPAGPTTVEDDIREKIVDLRLKEARELEKKYDKLVERATIEKQIADRFDASVQDAFASGKLVMSVPDYRDIVQAPSEEDAVLVLGDSHVGKHVDPKQINGMESYGVREFLRRLTYIERTVVDLSRKHITSKIGTLHIIFTGDLVEGALNHASEIPMRELIVDQMHIAALSFFQLISHLAAYFPQIKCYGVGGNHARLMNQAKIPTENNFSNLDFVVMSWIQSLLEAANVKNARFILDENIFPTVDIKGWRFKIGHGSHLKGGDKALGIPAHSMGREINATTQRYNAKARRARMQLEDSGASAKEILASMDENAAPDFYIVGDKHKGIEVSTANGSYMINGAFFSGDGYSTHLNFAPCRPFQRFFGVHARKSLSWSYPIWLDQIDVNEIPYTFPERLTSKIA